MSAQEEQPRLAVKPTPIPYTDKENAALNHVATLTGSKPSNSIGDQLAGSKRSALSEASGDEKPAAKRKDATEVDAATMSNLTIGAKGPNHDDAPFDEKDLDAKAQLEKQDSELACTLAMLDTPTGKAWNFVSRVLAFQQHMRTSLDPEMNANNFKTVNQDDMVFLAERMFEKQDTFIQAGKPFHVDIGYHYTHSNSMDRVRTDGLLSNAERQERNIRSRWNGATFGDGIYTSNNCFSYHAFGGGDVGLFVARLMGNAKNHAAGIEDDPTVDTLIGRGGDSDEVIVLRSSEQCISLIQFGSPMIELNYDASMGNQMVHKYHVYLQEIVDECFNGGIKTAVPRVFPSQVLLRCSGNGTLPVVPVATRSTIFATEEVKYEAPDSLHDKGSLSRLLEIAPPPVANSECAICLELLAESQAVIVRLVDCKHEFHESCIESALSHCKKCPTCRKAAGKPQGKMPSGKMTIEWRSDLTCGGYSPGAMVLKYSIDSGIQKQYHENPGMSHGSATRIAFLPDNAQGQQLLKRLKFAFACGLTFTVGTSLTTGVQNTVTWSSIHHKTSLSGGVHGFPDAGYFINANEELDALDVPSADEL